MRFRIDLLKSNRIGSLSKLHGSIGHSFDLVNHSLIWELKKSLNWIKGICLWFSCNRFLIWLIQMKRLQKSLYCPHTQILEGWLIHFQNANQLLRYYFQLYRGWLWVNDCHPRLERIDIENHNHPHYNKKYNEFLARKYTLYSACCWEKPTFLQWYDSVLEQQKSLH